MATEVAKGACDYATAYELALLAQPGLLRHVDLDLYCHGLLDRIETARVPQIAVNETLDLLLRLSAVPTWDMLIWREMRGRRTVLIDLFGYIARERLTVLLPHRWTVERETVIRRVAVPFETGITQSGREWMDSADAHPAE